MASPLHRSIRKHRLGKEGFTLVELLVVLSIILLLSALVIPAAGSMLRGSQLTQGAGMVADQLGFARQSALSMNCSVEVRLYQFGDSSVGENVASPSQGKYRAMQCFSISSATGKAAPFGKVRYLPNAVVIDSGTTLSSIIGSASASGVPTLTTGTALNAPLPRVGTQYNAVVFRFLPDGSTNFTTATSTSQSWFFTVHGIEAGDALTTPPKNFVTYQINSNNGHVQFYRP